DKPVTVKMPPGFVGVQVFKQIGLGGGGLGGGLDGGLGGGLGGGGLGGGGQALGGGAGGLGGGGYGGGGLGGGGGGFFSSPPEAVERIPFKSVCLEYGKTEPMPSMPYEVRPMDEFTDKPELQALIVMVGTNKLDPDAAQAAAWHLSSGLSWAQ